MKWKSHTAAAAARASRHPPTPVKPSCETRKAKEEAHLIMKRRKLMIRKLWNPIIINCVKQPGAKNLLQWIYFLGRQKVAGEQQSGWTGNRRGRKQQKLLEVGISTRLLPRLPEGWQDVGGHCCGSRWSRTMGPTPEEPPSKPLALLLLVRRVEENVWKCSWGKYETARSSTNLRGNSPGVGKPQMKSRKNRPTGLGSYGNGSNEIDSCRLLFSCYGPYNCVTNETLKTWQKKLSRRKLQQIIVQSSSKWF